MLYQISIALCLLGAPKCDRLNNVGWEYVPQPVPGLAACMIAGQQHAATKGLGSKDTMIKVFCTPYSIPERVA